MPFAADVAALVTPPHAVVAPAKQTAWTTITVRSGDTLWALAIKHRTTTAAIVTKNRLAARWRGHPRRPEAARARRRRAAKPAPGTAGDDADEARDHAPEEAGHGAARPRRALRRDDVGHRQALQGRASRTLLATNRLRASSYIFVGQRITIPGARRGRQARSEADDRQARPRSRHDPKPSTARAAAVAASKARLAAMTVPSRTETADLIRSIATRHGVDPKLALAIGWLESGWYQRAVSYTNAVGVMQIMPITGTWASQLAGRKLDLYDVRDNITAGVLVLRALQNMAESKDQAIAAYYQGLYSVRTRGLFTDTKAYVANVKAIYARL